MSSLLTPPTEAAISIPENATHAVSVSLPLWKDNVAYEEGEPEISAKIKSGYPRFKIHFKIEELAARLEHDYGRDGERAMLFSTIGAARRCREFIKQPYPDTAVRVLQLSSPLQRTDSLDDKISCVFFAAELFPIAKQYWQHTGEGVSSRHAQYFLERIAEADAHGIPPEVPPARDESAKGAVQTQEVFVEERFGRYLSVARAQEAKDALRKRISAELTRRGAAPVDPEHVFLYASGMTAIYSAYRVVLEALDADRRGLKAVCFGFPYTDTLKILQKWGPGVEFLPFGDDDGDLVTLERKLASGEFQISSLFCEVPSNPLLNTPNLPALRRLADKYHFVLVVDDTVGNMANVDTLSHVDICVSSLTKLFSGDCNVMAGELVLNPTAPLYAQLRAALDQQYVDGFWAEDAIYLERNSRDFYDRNQRINATAEAIVDTLLENKENHPAHIIREVNYPKCSRSRANYDAIKFPDGGYGGLLSIVFNKPEAAIAFYDTLFIAKGPSLGTNFTLGCPYTIIAHYAELDFAAECGVDTHLVRISIGLEEKDDLIQRFKVALDAAEHAVS